MQALPDLLHGRTRERVAKGRRRIRCGGVQAVTSTERSLVTFAGHDHHCLVPEDADRTNSYKIVGLKRRVRALNEEFEADPGVQHCEPLNASDIDTAKLDQ